MTPKLRWLIAVLLILGIFFRFYHLDQKFYWYDETFTSLRISGYTEAEVVEQVTQGQIISVQDLQQYQQPNLEKNIFYTIRGLAEEEAQLTPLYFILARFWVQFFGYSITIIRSLSALISLLVFPCIYWLCQELFQSSVVGLFSIALIAISPFHILYAQEARPYSLWTVMILLSSACLLKAMRLKRFQDWVLYTLTIILGLYSHLLLILVVIGHGIYIIVLERFRFSKNVRDFGLAAGIGLLAFLPWVIMVIQNFHQVQDRISWIALENQRWSLIKNWSVNTSRNFFDFGVNSDSSMISLVVLFVGLSNLWVLIGYSIYFLCVNTPYKTWLFILTLIGVTAIAIILPDLIFGGLRSTKSRYFIPSFLGIRLSISYLFANKIHLLTLKSSQKKFWKVIFAILISSGILSCVISSQSQIWWNKEWGEKNPIVAEVINQETEPLVISNLSDSSLGNVFSLSYLLNSDAKFQLVRNATIPKLPENSNQVFVYGPSQEFVTQLQQELQVEFQPITSQKNKIVWLWKKV